MVVFLLDCILCFNWTAPQNLVFPHAKNWKGKTLTSISKWLKDSGLKINESKTELCLFHRNDHAPIQITVNGITLTSKPPINFLGVQFDSKLSWSDQVNKTINIAKKTYHAINLIKKYFNQHELKGLWTSNYFSVLYNLNMQYWKCQGLPW